MVLNPIRSLRGSEQMNNFAILLIRSQIELNRMRFYVYVFITTGLLYSGIA